MSGIQLLDCSKMTINWKNDTDIRICRHEVITKFFNVALFLLSSLVSGPSFMSVSSLVLELWQFSFIRDWPEIRKSDIPLSEFCQISRDWGELGIPNLTQVSLIKRLWLLQNARVTFYRFWVIRGKPTGE